MAPRVVRASSARATRRGRVLLGTLCVAVAVNTMGAWASDFHADGALAMPYESRAERAMRERLSEDESGRTRTTAVGDAVGGGERAALARLVLRAVERRRAAAVRDATSDAERERAEMELGVVREAIESARDASEVGERRGARAALGYAGEGADVWAGSGGLMESIERRGGVPGSNVRRAGPIDPPEMMSEEEAMARFMSTRKRSRGSGVAAKERFAGETPWFKPKQPAVYWKVDLDKIERARAALEAKRVENSDFDFEITDMPIKAKKAESRQRLAALGEERQQREEKIEMLDNLKMPGNASSIDDAFSEKVEQWTRSAAKSFFNATKSAKHTMDKVSQKAIEVEQDLFMKHIEVRMYVDFADPNSLEFVLGALHKLQASQLGPVRWRIIPFVNVGQGHNVSVNCLNRGHSRHLSCSTNLIATCAEENIGKIEGGSNAFASCYAMHLLKLEAQDAFKYGGHEQKLRRIDDQCCSAVTSGLLSAGASKSTLSTGVCAAQVQCASGQAGLELLKANEAELGSIDPAYKWLPWVTIDGVPVCEKRCNLQAEIRRGICDARTTLPDGCPKFPWAEAWYDEPEISFGGLVAASAAVLLATISLFVLMREAGLKPFGLFRETDANASTDTERARLLNT